MRGSLNLGKIFGIKVLVHFTFILIFVYVGYYSYSQFHQVSEVLYDFLITMLAFLCVVMHEFGHALAARRVGIQTRQIVLLPIGGMAQLNNMPEKPSEELFVTLCGPLVNLLIVLAMLPVILLNHTLSHFANLVYGTADADYIAMFVRNHIPLALFFINCGLFVFNLVPAFPMDGGRIFRALLAYRLPYLKATLIAARTGQLIAISVLGYFTYLNLTSEIHFMDGIKILLLASFIILLAGMEYSMVKRRYAPAINPASVPHSGMTLNFGNTLSEAVSLLQRGYSNLPVVHQNKIAGTIVRVLPADQQYRQALAIPDHTWHFSPGDTLAHTIHMMEILEIPVLKISLVPECYLVRATGEVYF